MQAEFEQVRDTWRESVKRFAKSKLRQDALEVISQLYEPIRLTAPVSCPTCERKDLLDFKFQCSVCWMMICDECAPLSGLSNGKKIDIDFFVHENIPLEKQQVVCGMCVMNTMRSSN